MPSETPTFEIGLAMAGAISAGAYSAGVFDFLVYALDEWQKEMDAGNAGVPNHRVILKVMSGASAGAITGAIGVIGLAGGMKPTFFDSTRTTLKCVLPSMYQAWVVKPRLVAPAGGTDLLSLDDLIEGPPPKKEVIVPSLLNSIRLTEIRDEALAVDKPASPRPYIATDLHVYFTISNLRGIPYSISFAGAGGGFGMEAHADRLHYKVQGLGSTESPSVWAEADAFETIRTEGLFGDGPARTQWEAFGTAALASAAFPIGLAPRLITARWGSYDERYLPVEMEKMRKVPPTWPDVWPAGGRPKSFDFLSVDGGLIDNEPFEYARYALMKKPPEPNQPDGRVADRAVIMIDPFPTTPAFRPEGAPPEDILSVAAALFPTLISQARFKPSELMNAAREDVFSRFLIAPHRDRSGPPSGRGPGDEARFAIASGLLGGFGGFLEESFRAHDYQLGRRNCQRFLQNNFALPAENVVIESWPPSVRADPRFRTPDPDKGGNAFFPIIPLTGGAADIVEALPWPRMTENAFETLQKRIMVRMGAVLPRLIESRTTNVFLRQVLKISAFISKSWLGDYVRWMILSDLIRRDQIEGWDLPAAPIGLAPDDFREIVAQLASPAYTYRTASGIARATHLSEPLVDAALEMLVHQTGRKCRAWTMRRDAIDVYTLALRRPSSIFDLPGLMTVHDHFKPPEID